MGISIWQLLIILAIVLVLFGAKRLRNLGGDLGSAVKSFKGAMKEGAEDTAMKKEIESGEGKTIDAEVTSKKEDKV